MDSSQNDGHIDMKKYRKVQKEQVSILSVVFISLVSSVVFTFTRFECSLHLHSFRVQFQEPMNENEVRIVSHGHVSAYVNYIGKQFEGGGEKYTRNE